MRLLSVLSLFALATPAAAAPCNATDAHSVPAVGRALRPGTVLYSEGFWPTLTIEKIKLPAASKTKNKVVINGDAEPDLRRTWLRKGPLVFESVGLLAGCKVKPALRTLDFTQDKPARVPELALASWCEGDLSKVRLVSPDEAWTYSQTGKPYCVEYGADALDPRGMGQDLMGGTVAPWTSTKRLWLVANLPKPAERTLEVRLKLTLHENDAAACVNCYPDETLDCGASSKFRVQERTMKVPMKGARTHAIEILELDGLDPKHATHLELDARLFARGEDLAHQQRELRWALCM
jgi:hypothetical protein